MPTLIPQKILARQHEITADYLRLVDQNLDDLLKNRIDAMMEIRDIADKLHIHPTHLSNTIKMATGKAPCWFFEEKIMNIARTMLQQNQLSINQIATKLTYDPSNFTKFFKRFEGITPKLYREQILAEAIVSG